MRVSAVGLAEARKLGIEVVGDVPWGTHFCQFYQTKEDLIDILVPYFRAGLENNEFCMWVTAEPLEAVEAEKALRKTVEGFAKYMKKGQIEVISYKDWYVKDGKFDSDRVLAGWVSKLEKALKKGFSGLRLTGNTFWLERNNWKAFTDYEAEVNGVIGNYKMVAMCTYCLDKCDANEVIDVVKNHQFAIIKRQGKWQLIQSFENKRISDELENSRKRLSSLYASMVEGVAVQDLVYDDSGRAVDYIVTDVNTSFETITGLTRSQAIGKRASELFGTGEPPYLNIYARVASSGKPESFETYFAPMKKHFIISVFSPENGRFSTVFHDITSRKTVEETLIESERRWSTTLMSIADAVIATDPLGNVAFMNTVAENLTGWSLGDALRKPVKQVFNVVNAFTRQEVEDPVAEVLGKGLIVGLANHTILIRKDRSEVPIDDSGAPIRTEQGETLGVVLVFRDITERKKTEETLRETRDYLDNLLNYANAPIIVWDPDFKITRFNHAFERLTGYNSVTVEGKRLDILFPEEKKKEAMEHIERTLRGEYWETVEIPILHTGGTVKTLLWNSANIHDRNGLVIATIAQGHDITERKQMQLKLEEYARHLEDLVDEKTKQLQDAERLSAIGQTASMIGHDIRNPLQVIVGSLDLMKMDLDPLPEGTEKENMKTSLTEVEKQVNYINKIILDLQDFTRTMRPTSEEFDLKNLANEVVSRMNIPSNIVLHVEVDETARRLKTDPTHVRRILGNLVLNAIQAMPNGGQLYIRARRDGDNTIIIIEDTGAGIPAENWSKVFQPLFTTKSKGQGLGLAVVKRLTEALGGTITFTSEEDRGVKFTLLLPPLNKDKVPSDSQIKPR